MRYTLGDAKRILTGSAHSKVTNIREKINDAIQALCGANPWEHEFLRRVVRITSAKPVFSLPQGVAGLVRACVNGRPVTLHGQDFQFLSSGPGDLNHVGAGYVQYAAQDLEDLGESPVWEQPQDFVCLAACYKGEKPQPPLTVTGIGLEGDEVTFKLTPRSFAEGRLFDEEHPVRMILSVVLDEATDGYVDLSSRPIEGGHDYTVIGNYHPKDKVPLFHRYRIPNFRSGPCDILAEVQIDPWPLVDDSDIVPFPSLEPIKCMMLAQWNSQNNETSTAEKYEKQAMSWLTRFNTKKNTFQTATVLNVPYNGSMGELSDWCQNL